ncbi:hypothetical protein FACS1894211_16470 [Clostridia bacterium]|nr:hypothetical protein FACS1894211_16470 [Clostridia bacterium]
MGEKQSEKKPLGKKVWLIPDCDLPPEGEGVLKGHESVIVVNDADTAAEIRVDIYFTDDYLSGKILWNVPAKRVRCFRINDASHMCGVRIPIATQYALKLTSDVPIVVQYGRLDNRQVNLAYYTVLPYCK